MFSLFTGSLDGASPCTGDSGGGFIIKRNNTWLLRGVVSATLLDYETLSCDLYKYSVYSDVAKYMEWIRSTLTED